MRHCSSLLSNCKATESQVLIQEWSFFLLNLITLSVPRVIRIRYIIERESVCVYVCTEGHIYCLHSL